MFLRNVGSNKTTLCHIPKGIILDGELVRKCLEGRSLGLILRNELGICLDGLRNTTKEQGIIRKIRSHKSKALS
jgi:hypothetical protein